MYMLWFKFILDLKFFELVSILFAIIPDYGNEYTTKENKNWTSFKNFAPNLNLNHNIYTSIYYAAFFLSSTLYKLKLFLCKTTFPFLHIQVQGRITFLQTLAV